MENTRIKVGDSCLNLHGWIFCRYFFGFNDFSSNCNATASIGFHKTFLFSFDLSCMALNDLIRSAPSEDILDLLPEIWETNFKVLDDIKVCLLAFLQFYLFLYSVL